MKKNILSAAVVFALVGGLAIAGGNALQSGPQVGKNVPGPFHPLNLTGAKAGQKNCLYCENGTNPVAMVFARTNSPQLTKLIQKIDQATVKNSSASMGSFVVYLNDSENLGDQLKTMATKQGIQKTVLSIDNPAGPKGYNVSKDADVTVVLYVDHTVKSNYAFRMPSELNDQAINQIINDVSKIVEKQ
jgi:hypothetical protein